MLVSAAGAILVTALCLALAIGTGAFQAAVRALALADASAWGECLALMIAVSVLRYLRLQLALTGVAPLPAFNASALHGSASALAPGKLGELVLPVVVRRLTGASFLAGTGLLVLFRVLDLVALLAAAVCAAALAGGAPGLVIPVVAAICVGPIALRRLMALPAGRSGRLWSLLSEAAAIAAEISPLRYYATFGLTLLIWFILWLAAFLAAAGAGLDASFAVAGLALAAASAAFASPVNGLANAGPFEAAFAGAYVALGFALAPALAAAILLHVCAAAAPILCLLFGGGAATLLRLRPKPGVVR